MYANQSLMHLHIMIIFLQIISEGRGFLEVRLERDGGNSGTTAFLEKYNFQGGANLCVNASVCTSVPREK